MQRSVTAAMALFVLFTPVFAWSEVQFWISVGSYKQAETAQRAIKEADVRLSESFSVIGVDTTKGYYYRVAAGPYSERSQAEDQIRVARQNGFDDAWMWAGQSDVFNENLYANDADLDLDRYNIDLSLDDEFDYSLDDLDDYVPGSEAFGPESNSETVPELVDEAPADFKLNKLRRDASVWPPPQAPTSDPPSFEVGSPPSQLIIDIGDPITLTKFQESQINISIDGNLDESQWVNLPGVNSFRVVDPDTDETPLYETVVKMFYTERGLYASFEMEQPRETLVQWYSGRDAGRLNRDNVGVTLDTSGEGRYGYWVNLALGGNQVDGTVLAERQFSGDWDGAWFGGTQTTEKGWNAEIFLPWSQMAMPKEAGARHINAYASRKVASLDERWAVPALPFTQPLFMSALQPLVLDEVDPQQQWSVFPFLSLTQDEVEDSTTSKLGTDIFWRPSTNFQLTATLKPDFGNVESDDVIVNLGAFETFFPEKRLFFKEGIEVFDATPRANDRRGQPLTALNTRRIGGRARAPVVPDGVTVPSRELGQPIELLGAVKAVGQLGKVRYGLLGASEDEAKFDVGEINYHQEGSDYGIARFIYEDKTRKGEYWALGTISTIASHSVEDATVHGIDYHYQSTGGRIKLDGQFLQSDIDQVGRGSGGLVDLRYNKSRGLNFGLGLTHMDDTIELNDLGFLRRNDITNARGFVDYSRSDLEWVRKANINSFVEYEENGDGFKTRKGLGTRIHLNLKNRSNLRVGLAYFPSRDEDRDSRDNGTFEVDGRSATSLDFSTDSSKRVSYSIGAGRDGELKGGHKYQGRMGVTWRPVDQVNIGAFANYQVRDGWLLWRDGRNFTTFASHEWRPKINFDYFLSAKQQIRLSAQWVGIKANEKNFYQVPIEAGALEDVSDPDPTEGDFTISRVNVQLRYRWEIAPLSELFVVYTLNGEHTADTGSFDELFQEAYDTPVGEQLVVKLRYRLGS
jgi:hypothetical protein